MTATSPRWWHLRRAGPWPRPGGRGLCCPRAATGPRSVHGPTSPRGSWWGSWRYPSPSGSGSARAWARRPGWSRPSSPGWWLPSSGAAGVQVSGPTGAMTVVLVPIIAAYGAGGVLVVGMMAGVLLLGLGYAGAGEAIRYVPVTVVEGFTVGIALIIAIQQVPLGARCRRRGREGRARRRRRAATDLVGRAGVGPGGDHGRRRSRSASAWPGCVPGVPGALVAVVLATS